MDNTNRILVTGSVGKGFDFFGPFHVGDQDGRAHARKRALEEGGEDYSEETLLPLDMIAPVDPDPEPAAPVAVQIDGVGELRPGDTYFQLVNGNGKRSNCYAQVGQQLIEAYDIADDGTPDWTSATICDPGSGDEEFFYPAASLLRFLSAATDGETSWCKADHDDLTDGLRRLGVESWTYDAGQDCYRVSQGADDEFVIRTPMDARAFVAGLRATRISR